MCKMIGKLPSGRLPPSLQQLIKRGKLQFFWPKSAKKKTSHKRATKYPLETFATKSVYLGQMSGTFKYSFFLFDFNAKNTKC